MNRVYLKFNAFEVQIYVKVFKMYCDIGGLFIKALYWTLSIVWGKIITHNFSEIVCCCRHDM